MDLARITQIVDQLAGSAARDIRIRSGDLDVRITFDDAAPGMAPMPSADPVAGAMPETTAETIAVRATVPGVAFLSPEPGTLAFVQIGDRVREGQTLLLIEAMKAMLTVPAPCDGRVADICIRNEAEVDLGDMLFRIEAGAA